MPLHGAGPKELPGIARGLGRQTGRAMAYIQTARQQIFQYGERNEINQVQAGGGGLGPGVACMLVRASGEVPEARASPRVVLAAATCPRPLRWPTSRPPPYRRSCMRS